MVNLLDVKNEEPDVDLAVRKVPITVDFQLILTELISETKPENDKIHLIQGKTKPVLNFLATMLENATAITTKSSGK